MHAHGFSTGYFFMAMFAFTTVQFVFHVFGIFTAVAIDTVFFQLLLFKFLFGMFDKVSFLQLEDSRAYPEPRPIGEMMAQIGDFEEIKASNMMSRTAEQDTAILGGSNLNDDEDIATTLESMKTAEKMTGTKLKEVESNR